MFKKSYFYFLIKLILLRYLKLKLVLSTSITTLFTIYSYYLFKGKYKKVVFAYNFIGLIGIHRIKPQHIGIFFNRFYIGQLDLFIFLNKIISKYFFFKYLLRFNFTVSNLYKFKETNTYYTIIYKIILLFKLKLPSNIKKLKKINFIKLKYKRLYSLRLLGALYKKNLYNMLPVNSNIINSCCALINSKVSVLNVVSTLRYNKFFNKIKFSRNRQVVFSIVQFGLFINILFILLGSSVYYQITPDLSYCNVLLYLVSITQIYFWVVFLSGFVNIKFSVLALPLINTYKLFF